MSDQLISHSSPASTLNMPLDTPNTLNEKQLIAPVTDAKPPAINFNKGSKFWLIFLALCVSCLLSALDLTAISTALPTIVSDLGASDYVWVGSAYALTSTAFLPFAGDMARILGRKSSMLFSLCIFMLGSGLAGGSKYMKSMDMLIAARSIQGIGGGGILAMTEIVVADMVPLSERGAFAGIVCPDADGDICTIGFVWAFASAIGPLVGGALSKEWSYLFFINLPLGLIAVLLVIFFLDIKAPKDSFRNRIRQFDLVGNVLIIGSTTAFVLGLVWGGASYAWTSYKVLVPLIIGVIGFLAALFWDFKYAQDPTIPYEILNNRTALGGYIAIFIHGIIMMIVVYFIPTYFQAVKGQGPVRSAVSMLPISMTTAPFAIVAGIAVQITGKYVWANYVGWGVMTLGVGLLALLKSDSNTGTWVSLQLVAGIGAGLLYTGPQFGVLAPTPPRLNAPALAFLTFTRSMGQLIGVVVGSAVLDNELTRQLPAAFTAEFGESSDIAYSIIPSIRTLTEPLQSEVIEAFVQSLRMIWLVCIGICAIGIASVLMLKSIPLTTVTDENWGINEQKVVGDAESQ